MNSTKTCFVTLTPRQLFFFGGEQGQMADYYVKGRFLPQQTALLGLVRHQVLLQNNLLANNRIVDDTEATKWIGEKSFEFSNKSQSFGKIQKLSPSYIVGNSQKYLPFHQAFAKNLRVLDGNYYLPDFDPKKHYVDAWMSLNKSDGTNVTEFHEEVIKPGVDKNYEGKTEKDDKAYYKQVWLKMKSGYAFGFYVEMEEDVKFKTADVAFGKEGAVFYMQVSEPLEKPEPFQNEKNPTAVVLTSDAYVEEDIISLADFAITDTIPFRNIISKTSSNTNYYQLDQTEKAHSNTRKSSFRLLLLKRGSVFYCKNGKMEKIISVINSCGNFKKIGYNHYHKIKIEY